MRPECSDRVAAPGLRAVVSGINELAIQSCVGTGTPVQYAPIPGGSSPESLTFLGQLAPGLLDLAVGTSDSVIVMLEQSNARSPRRAIRLLEPNRSRW